MKKKTDSESFGSEYAMSAGDNALTREQINDSIVSQATANEHSFRAACMAGYENTPPLPAVDEDTKMATELPPHRTVKAVSPGADK